MRAKDHRLFYLIINEVRNSNHMDGSETWWMTAIHLSLVFRFSIFDNLTVTCTFDMVACTVHAYSIGIHFIS